METFDRPEKALNRPNTVLVTGAGARVGRWIAIDLSKRGWRVAVHYNASREGADETVAQIAASGGEAAAFRADLASEAEVAALIPQIDKEFGTLGALINCASVFEADDIRTMTRESWDLHLNVNLRAPVKLIQDFDRALPDDAYGDVINIIDQRVLKLTPQFMSYLTSKDALWTLTRTLAQALAPRIRVNAVSPGPTLRNPRQSEDDWRKQNEAAILGHGSSPHDIANAVAYLLDAEAATGQMITVDGGQHLIWRTPDVHGLTE